MQLEGSTEWDFRVSERAPSTKCITKRCAWTVIYTGLSMAMTAAALLVTGLYLVLKGWILDGEWPVER